ncbi:hypothetical protein TELCIR_16152 [Teladorsagia circumcincta]|uniref:NR LBD domain-containing protein n=1 Tax=Teladorsagia circumcincta TaxID=45464 RepID=A0A2G9TWH5_TELCI|nr:hypothetical protein TELCIR_16152 [Teladorsagia circumcincta]
MSIFEQLRDHVSLTTFLPSLSTAEMFYGVRGDRKNIAWVEKKARKAGMSRSWLIDQKPRVNSRKRAATADDGDNPTEEVSVSKAYLNELIRKAKRQQACCECRCTCGFYPPDTRLTAVETGKTDGLYYLSSYTPLQSPLSPASMVAFSPMMSSLQPSGCQDAVISSGSKCANPTQETFDERKYAKLSAEDLHLVQELIRANEPLKAPLDFQFKEELTLMDVVKISEAGLKRIVCMARDLAAFQALDIEDKKNIMKGFLTRSFESRIR